MGRSGEGTPPKPRLQQRLGQQPSAASEGLLQQKTAKQQRRRGLQHLRGPQVADRVCAARPTDRAASVTPAHLQALRPRGRSAPPAGLGNDMLACRGRARMSGHALCQPRPVLPG